MPGTSLFHFPSQLNCLNQSLLLTYWLIYLLTYLLIPWSRVLFEKLTGSQLVKKLSAFHRTRRFNNSTLVIVWYSLLRKILICLFLYDAVSDAEYRAPEARMADKCWIWKELGKSGHSVIDVLYRYAAGRMRKTTEPSGSRCPRWESKQISPNTYVCCSEQLRYLVTRTSAVVNNSDISQHIRML